MGFAMDRKKTKWQNKTKTSLKEENKQCNNSHKKTKNKNL